MASNLEKLRVLLQELFQLDQADLDFGIYRIMNQKRDEIVRFLDNDLLPQVKDAFGHYQSADRVEIQKELDKLVQNITNAGMNPDDSPKVKELKEKLTENAVDVAALENNVFSHLYNFFRRYYSDGDFISLRRYKAGVYAIPYEGEEVKLHWANADQYYVKSSETFRDYTFTTAEGKRVRVHLVAASTEKDNNKEALGKERCFLLANNPLSEENGELFIRFEYRTHDGSEKQDDLNKQAIDTVLNTPGFEKWLAELRKLAPTDKKRDRTVLEKHLMQYTTRNSFDYFIHKDLGRFLRRELDFYIKNEVMHLDDIEHESAPKVEQYLSEIKVIRCISHKVIQFLEQLEDFQKKLWLKKKFVIDTNYCITLDRVPNELYRQIVANDAQRDEWVRLFAIDEIQKDLSEPGYSIPITEQFLKDNPFLVLDTKHFSNEFKTQLVAHIDNLDEHCEGTLVASDNFHAINLLRRRFHETVRFIHIDPPYNTETSGFLYKNGYQHSTWMAMMSDRLRLATEFLAQDAVMAVHIDENEMERLGLLLDDIGIESAGTMIWDKGAPVTGARGLATQHEYVLWRVKGGGTIRAKKKNTSEIEQKAKELFEKHRESSDTMRSEFRKWLRETKTLSKAETTYDSIDEKGRVFRSDNLSATDRRTDPKYHIPLLHPTTKQHCPVPPHGWRNTPESLARLIGEGAILFGADHTTMPRRKSYLSDTPDSQMATVYTSGKRGKFDADNFGIEFPFSHPVSMYVDMADAVTEGDAFDVVFDFFGGSGTTAHSVLALNRKDGGNRRFILVEMGDYVEKVTKVRIAKAVYSSEWRDGKPKARDGMSHCFKYLRLESYEDALSNLELKRTTEQEKVLFDDPDAREQFVLSYMLNVESRGSQSLLNVAGFRNPDQYKLKVEQNGESQLVNVDLVETFNWLLGLTVKHIDLIRGVRVVEGTNPDGERVLVLWRNCDKTGSDKLDDWFGKQGYSTRDLEYDLVYVNGDNNLENLRRTDQTWKVRLIEDEFQRLMFDVQD